MADTKPKLAPTSAGTQTAAAAPAKPAAAVAQTEKPSASMPAKTEAAAAVKTPESPSPALKPVAVAPAAAPLKDITPAARKVAASKAPAKKVAVKKAPASKAVAKRTPPKPVVTAAAKVAAPLVEKAKAAVSPAMKTLAQTVQKEVTNMATTFEKFEAPTMFNDFNDRTKAAVEKSGKLAQEMGEFGKGNVEALVESGRIAAKGFEAIGQDAAEYSRKSFDGLTATLKNLSSVKSPTDFFKLQSEYLRGAFDSAVAQSSKNTEAMIKLAGDAAQPLSSRFALAAEKVKTAA